MAVIPDAGVARAPGIPAPQHRFLDRDCSL